MLCLLVRQASIRGRDVTCVAACLCALTFASELPTSASAASGILLDSKILIARLV